MFLILISNCTINKLACSGRGKQINIYLKLFEQVMTTNVMQFIFYDSILFYLLNNKVLKYIIFFLCTIQVVSST